MKPAKKAAKKAPRQPKRSRVQVTPSPELWLILDELHTLTGQPKSALIAEMLDQIAPAFQTMIDAIRMVAEAPREAQRLMNNMAAGSVSQLMQANLELDQKITQQELELAPKDKRTVKGRRARGPT